MTGMWAFVILLFTGVCYKFFVVSMIVIYIFMFGAGMPLEIGLHFFIPKGFIHPLVAIVADIVLPRSIRSTSRKAFCSFRGTEFDLLCLFISFLYLLLPALGLSVYGLVNGKGIINIFYLSFICDLISGDLEIILGQIDHRVAWQPVLASYFNVILL